MTATLTKLYRFSASHRLHLSHLTDEENTRLYGKCNNPYGHGHDYVLAITAENEIDPQTGQVLAIAELDALVRDRVLNLFEHRNINLDVPQFSSLVATTENMTKVVSELLGRDWEAYVSGSARLARVHIQETDRNGFEVVIRPGEMNSLREVRETVAING